RSTPERRVVADRVPPAQEKRGRPGSGADAPLPFRDGGKTWSEPKELDLLGREPYLTVLKDGTVFITGHLLANPVRVIGLWRSDHQPDERGEPALHVLVAPSGGMNRGRDSETDRSHFATMPV